MGIENINWSPEEKKIARKAFDKAYQTEINEIKKTLTKKINSIENDKDVWEIHNYLTKRREAVDEKYDYRYSKLIIVFGILINEKYLTIDDLKGLNKDKLELINNF